MELHYMDGGPFETHRRFYGKERVFVLGYDPGAGTFLAMYSTGETFWGTSADRFDPPPPIPAAARKPQVGEVWVLRHDVPVIFVSADKHGSMLGMQCDGGSCWRCREEFIRPATPEEAEPFRPILDGLKRSLGEA